MLALPAVSAPAGIVPTSAGLVAIWGLLTLDALLIAEVNLAALAARRSRSATDSQPSAGAAPAEGGIVTLRQMAEFSLGKAGKGGGAAQQATRSSAAQSFASLLHADAHTSARPLPGGIQPACVLHVALLAPGHGPAGSPPVDASRVLERLFWFSVCCPRSPHAGLPGPGLLPADSLLHKGGRGGCARLALRADVLAGRPPVACRLRCMCRVQPWAPYAWCCLQLVPPLGAGSGLPAC